MGQAVASGEYRGLQDVKIVVVEDDLADWMMIEEAFEDAQVTNNVSRIKDGVDLLEYLRDPTTENPGLILLDLNMPRLDGFETLAAIRADPNLQHLAVVIMTTSNAEVDVLKSYKGGANSYIIKPLSFEGMIDAIKTIGKYWFQLVTIPTQKT